MTAGSVGAMVASGVWQHLLSLLVETAGQQHAGCRNALHSQVLGTMRPEGR